MKVQGRCHCGAITYEAEVEPGKVNICHCLDCQMLTGSAFRANAPTTAFRLLRGTPKIYVKTADSGAQRAHSFCADCGTPIYATSVESPTSWSLRIGTLDQRYELGAPRRQIWTSRRHPWVCEMADVPAVEGQP